MKKHVLVLAALSIGVTLSAAPSALASGSGTIMTTVSEPIVECSTPDSSLQIDVTLPDDLQLQPGDTMQLVFFPDITHSSLNARVASEAVLSAQPANSLETAYAFSRVNKYRSVYQNSYFETSLWFIKDASSEDTFSWEVTLDHQMNARVVPFAVEVVRPDEGTLFSIRDSYEITEREVEEPEEGQPYIPLPDCMSGGFPTGSYYDVLEPYMADLQVTAADAVQTARLVIIDPHVLSPGGPSIPTSGVDVDSMVIYVDGTPAYLNGVCQDDFSCTVSGLGIDRKDFQISWENEGNITPHIAVGMQDVVGNIGWYENTLPDSPQITDISGPLETNLGAALPLQVSDVHTDADADNAVFVKIQVATDPDFEHIKLSSGSDLLPGDAVCMTVECNLFGSSVVQLDPASVASDDAFVMNTKTAWNPIIRDKLERGTTYYVRIAVRDTKNSWSDFSAPEAILWGLERIPYDSGGIVIPVSPAPEPEPEVERESPVLRGGGGGFGGGSSPAGSSSLMDQSNTDSVSDSSNPTLESEGRQNSLPVLRGSAGQTQVFVRQLQYNLQKALPFLNIFDFVKRPSFISREVKVPVLIGWTLGE